VQFGNVVELGHVGRGAAPPQSCGACRIDPRLHQAVADDGSNGVPGPRGALAEVCGRIEARSLGRQASLPGITRARHELLPIPAAAFR
jgi:hypothetical protein